MNLKRNVHAITRQRAIDFLWNETQGRIFSVYFQKTDGTMRDMVCRRGVARYLRGGELPYEPRSKNLLPVFDMQIAANARDGSEGYRMVNLNTIVSFNIGGETFILT